MEAGTRGLLPSDLRDDLYRTCRKRLPYESCGAMIGSRSGGAVKVTGFLLVRNIAPDPRVSFRFDPDGWLAACARMQKNQRDIVGVWHSHPSGPALPSVRDAEGWDGHGTYWIVGLEAGRAELRAFVREGAAWLPLPIDFI
ncbi:Mov34/MPN/PAD-1 family protein [Cohnella fermenti]|uniref:M67 family metallopeptidase n=1 Tax=Cohnella fermenti TaxID=2565925 RepID=A0A4S4C8A2_9BACL|nr:M67 family metallopeptidase [Cohnella fermenti]THF83874.1 M67 family metallopeptidase [Cohnella fermenti]